MTRESERKFIKGSRGSEEVKIEFRSFADFLSGDSWLATPEIELPEEEAKHKKWLENYVEDVKRRFEGGAEYANTAS